MVRRCRCEWLCMYVSLCRVCQMYRMCACNVNLISQLHLRLFRFEWSWYRIVLRLWLTFQLLSSKDLVRWNLLEFCRFEFVYFSRYLSLFFYLYIFLAICSLVSSRTDDQIIWPAKKIAAKLIYCRKSEAVSIFIIFCGWWRNQSKCLIHNNRTMIQ